MVALLHTMTGEAPGSSAQAAGGAHQGDGHGHQAKQAAAKAGIRARQEQEYQSILAMLDDGIEWTGYDSNLIPFTGSYHGKDEVAHFLASLEAARDVLRFEPQNFHCRRRQGGRYRRWRQGGRYRRRQVAWKGYRRGL